MHIRPCLISRNSSPHRHPRSALSLSSGVTGLALLFGGVGIGCGDPDTLTGSNEVPTVELIKPDGLTSIKPGPIYIELTANDPPPAATAKEDLKIHATMSRSGATGTDATVNVNCASVNPTTSGLYTCTSLNEFDAGDYVLRITAEDAKGATSEPVSVSVPIVNDLPICKFTTPGSGTSEHYDQSVPTTLILTCEDPDGDTSKVEVEINSDQSGFLGLTKPVSDGTTTLQVKFTKAGVHIVTATATDADGGVGIDTFTAIVAACEDFDNDGFNGCISISDPPDCDDEDATSNPDQVEFCNGKDSDCDGSVDNIVDTDHDNYFCDDCNNEDLNINPGATERCDGIDNDCDEDIDENFDADGDGYLSACDPDGMGIDCNDLIQTVNPGAIEACDGQDTDCNGIVDDRDQDGDGYVDIFCTEFTGDNSGDCNDNSLLFNPGITEVCNGEDENCDGFIDNNTECFDDDGDGYCETTCTNGGPDGDCDDTFKYTYPGAVERFDHRDNDCDGETEGRAVAIDKAWLFLDGPVGNAYLGEAVDGGHDLSGDGIDDIIIGARGYDSSGTGAGRGGAFVVHGREDWDVGATLSVAALPSSYAYSETDTGAQGGLSVSSLGDVNDDGLGDFAVGSPYTDVTKLGVSLTDAGSAYLFLGKENGWGNTTLTTATSRMDGISSGVNVGASLTGGDINGDGLADFIVGAPSPSESSNQAGWVFVLTGRYDGFPTNAGPSSIYKGQGNAGQTLGEALAFIGHHDSDGDGDFVVVGSGNASQHGLVMRMPGSDSYQSGDDGQLNASTTGVWTGNQTSERIGSSISGQVDINGDGNDDFLIGRSFMDPLTDSMAFAVLGSDSLPIVDGDVEVASDVRFIGQETDVCPCAVVGIGDMNGDGFGDFAISAAFAEVNGVAEAGRVYLFYGRTPADDPWPAEVQVKDEADGIFYGTEVGHRVGLRLGRAGDINGDCYDDLAIGAPQYSPLNDGGTPVSFGGRVFVQFGAPTGPVDPTVCPAN